MSMTETGPQLRDPRIETWVLTDSPRPMVAQLRGWARLHHGGEPRVVLVEVGSTDEVSWPVFALVGRLATILRAQQSCLGLVIQEGMRARAERAGLADGFPVFSAFDEGLAWAESWLRVSAS